MLLLCSHSCTYLFLNLPNASLAVTWRVSTTSSGPLSVLNWSTSGLKLEQNLGVVKKIETQSSKKIPFISLLNYLSSVSQTSGASKSRPGRFAYLGSAITRFQCNPDNRVGIRKTITDVTNPQNPAKSLFKTNVKSGWAFIYLAYSRKYEIEKERLLSKDACVRRKAG